MKTRLLEILHKLPPKEREEMVDELLQVLDIILTEKQKFSSWKLVEPHPRLHPPPSSFLKN